jgi:GH15 family glucan-1,4-alpha-glucosidase
VLIMGDRPIGSYGLLSDRHTGALVSASGSVDWLCFPRFDSAAVFAGLLGDEAGAWSVRPAAPSEVTRRYLDGTLVLARQARCVAGEVEVAAELRPRPEYGWSPRSCPG